MKKISLVFTLLLLLTACKSKKVITNKPPTKPRIVNTKRPTKSTNTTSKKNTNTSISTQKIINKAVSFKGTKYKYGGTTRSGMDCSGLMFTSFKAGNINLPRTSSAQSKKGKRIATKNILKGDLVFFKTSKKNRINHVGLVVSHTNGNVKFVHTSSSRGVMISSLKDGYWANTYAGARRISSASKTSSTNSSSIKKYNVKKGDTFYGIAKKYRGVSAQNIMDLNRLSVADLKPGMVLKIPD